MSAPTFFEQYMLELVNRERAKAGVQPLAFDGDLNQSADRHSRWMISTDTFSHTGAGRSQPTDRMAAAGYSFEGSWTSGENIAWASVRSPTGFADEAQLLHGNLMRSPPHRANILSATFQEVGIGFRVGSYENQSAAFVTQNFARTATDPFVTGVAFDDRDGDRFYDPGEGLGGLTVKAVSAAGAAYETATSGSGGYGLPVPAGTYTVTFSGPGIAPVTKTVAIGTENVKVDLVDPGAGAAAKAARPDAPAADAPRPAGATRDGAHGPFGDADLFAFGPPAAAGGADRDGARGTASGPPGRDAPEAEIFGSPREPAPDRPEPPGPEFDRSDDRWHPDAPGSVPPTPIDLIV